MRSLLIASLPIIAAAKTCLIELPYELPILLESTGKYRTSYDDESSSQDHRFSKKAQLEAKTFGLSWGDDSSSCDSFTLEPLKGSRILINGCQYEGMLKFQFGKKIINQVDIDVIVQNMMQKKEFLGLHPETLKALAVVLRTDLVSESRLFKAEELDYHGSSLLYQFPKIAEAVVETKHHVMKWENHVFPTTYCLDAAGKNAGFQDIFRQKVSTPIGTYLPSLPTKQWQKEFSKEQICQKLNIAHLMNLSFYKDKHSGKIYAIKLTDEKGSKVLLIERFMELLELASNQFDLSVSKNNFSFKGQGMGLGVGLCLKTAEHLAKDGSDYKQILQICYPDTSLDRSPQ